MQKLEDLWYWQKAQTLLSETYFLFKENKDYSFKDQIQRAIVSVANNIAEGFERQGDKEYRRFLYIAKGSCGEYRSMIYSAKLLNYINQETYEKLFDNAIQISRMLGGMIKVL